MDVAEPKTPAEGAAATEPTESLGETPQTASIAPTLAPSDGAPRKGRDVSPRRRVALALVGGAAGGCVLSDRPDRAAAPVHLGAGFPR